MESCKKLDGKFGVITGAASGIGRSTALQLAREGAALVLVDLIEDELQALAQEISASDAPSPLALTVDVTSDAEVDRMAAVALETFHQIDFLVTSAGILRRTRFPELEPSEWDLVMAVNLRGPYLCCRAVVPAMIRQGGGAILNVASLAGRSCSVLGGAHYTASKHGVIGLSRHLARELGPHGIRVNAFCPGGTLTPMVEKNTPPDERNGYAAGWPLRRWSDPEEQAKVISFLVSDESSFITGASIDSNGGALML
jgi:NAD(P)-dependent dehydrogenase (short-subunit alcohol dehydrogenase family)